MTSDLVGIGRARHGGTGRFAPSPSGRMHLGNVFSALLAWLSARSRGAGFLLRLEDLDERCADAEAHRVLCDDLAWLGLDWDGDPVVQRGRERLYGEAVERIRAVAHVYPCFCSRADLHAASAPHASDGTPLYAGTCRDLTRAQVDERAAVRPGALRLEVPDAAVAFEDLHMGRFSQNLRTECGDFVIRRSDGVFAYQLVVVVDDADSGVGEVVRGSDLLSSTPRQMFLQRLLGLDAPCYAHHPMLLAPDGRRLSKREGDCDMGWLRDHVAGSEQLTGYLAWLAGLLADPEPVCPAELVGSFDWDDVFVEDIVLDGPRSVDCLLRM